VTDAAAPPWRLVLLRQFSKLGERNRHRKSLNNLVDMSAVNQLAVSWAVSAATIALLGLSAWHDRHRGYQRKRLDESGLEHAFGWLMEFRASLLPDDDAAVSAPTAPLFPSDQPDAAQLLRLDASLQRIKEIETAAVVTLRDTVHIPRQKCWPPSITVVGYFELEANFGKPQWTTHEPALSDWRTRF
jgi:hypothetical protein